MGKQLSEDIRGPSPTEGAVSNLDVRLGKLEDTPTQKTNIANTTHGAGLGSSIVSSSNKAAVNQ